MAVPISDTVERIRVKCALLQERYLHMLSELEQTRATNDELVADNGRLREDNQRLQLENEYLRLSHKVAPTDSELEQSKRLVADMLQKVDKCISYLNQG